MANWLSFGNKGKKVKDSTVVKQNVEGLLASVITQYFDEDPRQRISENLVYNTMKGTFPKCTKIQLDNFMFVVKRKLEDGWHRIHESRRKSFYLRYDKFVSMAKYLFRDTAYPKGEEICRELSAKAANYAATDRYANEMDFKTKYDKFIETLVKVINDPYAALCDTTVGEQTSIELADVDNFQKSWEAKVAACRLKIHDNYHKFRTDTIQNVEAMFFQPLDKMERAFQKSCDRMRDSLFGSSPPPETETLTKDMPFCIPSNTYCFAANVNQPTNEQKEQFVQTITDLVKKVDWDKQSVYLIINNNPPIKE